MVKSLNIHLFALLIAGALTCFAQSKAKVQREAAQALADATEVTLYSLEPTSKSIPLNNKTPNFHGDTILGKVELRDKAAKQAIKAFQDAVSGWGDPTGACFNPHHALRLVSGGHTYDYELCYECSGLALFKDGNHIANFTAVGKPDILNGLLTANRVPLPDIYSPENIAAEKKRIADEIAAEARWMATMPKSFQPLWKVRDHSGRTDLRPYQAALKTQFPDKDSQILALLRWYGSGAGPWSGFLAYEDVASELLLTYPTLDIIAVFKRNMLSREQLEGAARLFSVDIPYYRRKDLELLSPELKQLLLMHSLKSNDFDKIERAKRAFAN